MVATATSDSCRDSARWPGQGRGRAPVIYGGGTGKLAWQPHRGPCMATLTVEVNLARKLGDGAAAVIDRYSGTANANGFDKFATSHKYQATSQT